MTRATAIFAEFEQDPAYSAKRAELEPALTLAANILHLRALLDLSQAELAHRAGMRQPRIAELERARGNPRLDTIGRIARALGVTVADLLGGPPARRGILPAESATIAAPAAHARSRRASG